MSHLTLLFNARLIVGVRIQMQECLVPFFLAVWLLHMDSAVIIMLQKVNNQVQEKLKILSLIGGQKTKKQGNKGIAKM